MNKEIIFIDDGSSDRTLSIAHQFASKTVSVVSQENQGAAAAETERSPIARESTFNGWMLTISYHQTKDRAIK